MFPNAWDFSEKKKLTWKKRQSLMDRVFFKINYYTMDNDMNTKCILDHSKLENIPVVPDLSHPPPDLNWTLVNDLRDGVMRSAIFHAAIELGIFTYLSQSRAGMKYEELAEDIGLYPSATEVLLDCLTGLKLLHKDKKGHYSNSQEAKMALVEDSPYFSGARPTGINHSCKYPWKSFLKSIECAKRWIDFLTTGKTDLEPQPVATDGNNWADSIEAQVYCARVALRGHIHQTLNLLRKERVLKKESTLLDLGGGHGLFALAFARAFPGLRASVYEFPGVTKLTKRFLEAYGAKKQVDVIEGDMLVNPIPGHYDVIFCSNLWLEMDDMAQLALKARNALNPGGWIIWKLFFPPYDWSEFFVTYLMLVYQFLQKHRPDDCKNTPVTADVVRLMKNMDFESVKILGVVDNNVDNQATICVARKPANAE
jgi:SAM-dependent methyltransferase